MLAGWPHAAGGTGPDLPFAIARFPDGSTVLTGLFSGTATFGATTLTTAGDEDVFITRINPDGSHAWAVRAGGPRTDFGMGVATTPDGKSVLVTGIFSGAATFGATTLTAPSADQGCLFVARLDADGAFIWASGSGGPSDFLRSSSETPSPRIVTFADGSAVVSSGCSAGTVTFGGTSLPGDSDDVVVAKVKPDGQFAWAKRFGGAGAASAFDIARFADGSVVLTGAFGGTATFGGTTLSSAGGADIFVTRLSPGGQVAWARKAGGQGSDRGYGIATTADGSIVVTGSFAGTATFGATTLSSNGGEDVFVTRLTPGGQVAWARKAGGTGDDRGLAIAARADGSVLVTGRFAGTAAFGDTTLASGGLENVFVTRVAATGAFAWARSGGGADSGTGAAIAALPDGSAIVAGLFFTATTFGSTRIASRGSLDIFVAKITADGSFDVPPAITKGVQGTPGDGTVSLVWTAPVPNGGPAVSGHVIQYRPANQRIVSWTTVPAGAASAATSATVTGLANGRAYLFRVAAVNAGGAGPFSAPSAAVTPRTVPGTPGTLVGTGGNGRATLSWKPPTTSGGAAITGYLLQHSTDQTNWTTVPGVFPTTSAVVKGLVNGLAYTFRVAAVNAAGTGAFATSKASAIRPRGAPGMPTGFAASPGSGLAALSWTAPESDGGSPITGYRIVYARKVGAGVGPWVTVNRAASLPTTLAVGGLAGGSTYVFRIAAVNALGVGAFTSPDVLLTPGT